MIKTYSPVSRALTNVANIPRAHAISIYTSWGNAKRAAVPPEVRRRLCLAADVTPLFSWRLCLRCGGVAAKLRARRHGKAEP